MTKLEIEYNTDIQYVGDEYGAFNRQSIIVKSANINITKVKKDDIDNIVNQLKLLKETL